jgi:hypothetical protein
MEAVYGNAAVGLSKVRSPYFGLRLELRPEGFDPSAFLIFTLDTFDTSSMKYGLIGHAVMPLFQGAKSKTPVTDPNTEAFHLLQGNFQLPIHSFWPDDLSAWTYDKFTARDKIPCATLLV